MNQIALALVALLSLPSTLSAQHTWTNADLGKPLTDARPVPTAAQLQALRDRQYVWAEKGHGPYVFLVGPSREAVRDGRNVLACCSSAPTYYPGVGGYRSRYDRFWYGSTFVHSYGSRDFGRREAPRAPDRRPEPPVRRERPNPPPSGRASAGLGVR